MISAYVRTRISDIPQCGMQEAVAPPVDLCCKTGVSRHHMDFKIARKIHMKQITLFKQHKELEYCQMEASLCDVYP